MCLNAVLESPKARIENAMQVIENTIIRKIIFIFRIKGLIYSCNFSWNLNKFLVKEIWAANSKKINKIIIILLIMENKFVFS